MMCKIAIGGRSRLYDDFVPPFLHFARRHRGRRTTHQLENGLGHFFEWVDGNGIGDLESLTAQDIRGFMSSLQRFRPATIAVHASALRDFLRYVHSSGLLTVDLSLAVERPRLYRLSQPPNVLDSETVEGLLAAVDKSTPFGKRDFAILMLAARYGLRSSDIRSLCFESLLWREQRIVLLQRKTQRSLELPLLADVGEALIDYIRSGRPSCSAREVFVRHVAPIGPLALRNNLWSVMDRALKAAGLNLLFPRRGLHMLRHSLATRMLAQSISLDTISDILGHESVETTRRYAQVEMVGLQSVALPEVEVRR